MLYMFNPKQLETMTINNHYNIAIETYKMVLSYQAISTNYFETKKEANRWLKRFCTPLKDGKQYHKNKGKRYYSEVIWDYPKYKRLRNEKYKTKIGVN